MCSSILFCSKVIFDAMNASIEGQPGVNPPHLADTDTTDLEGEDEELAPGDDGRFHPPGSDDCEGGSRRRRNTGKSRQGSNGVSLLVETLKNGQSAFLKVMQMTHKSTIEQSYKIHQERETGREKSDAKMLEGFGMLAGAIQSLRAAVAVSN
jgi:hypothetical protein